MKRAAAVVKRLLRAVAIVLLVVAGSVGLVRLAPGYLSDAREMDGRYAGVARAEIAGEAARSHSFGQIMLAQTSAWAHGSLGVSRQYAVPVLDLIRPRLAISGLLMLRGIAAAWVLSFCAAVVTSSRRRRILAWQAPATLLLALPTAAMATLCLLADSGGATLVITLLLASRDFKFLDHLLSQCWREAPLLQARAQGVEPVRLLWAHVVPRVLPQLSALATLSIVTALSALVPVEVIFNVPGLGQLAWNAALNRDLPVLLAITMVMALCVTVAGMISDSPQEAGAL